MMEPSCSPFKYLISRPSPSLLPSFSSTVSEGVLVSSMSPRRLSSVIVKTSCDVCPTTRTASIDKVGGLGGWMGWVRVTGVSD